MGGRLVQIGTRSGAKGEVNLGTVMQRRLTITGSTLRSRTAAEKAELARAVREHVWPHLDSGAVRAIVHATFPLRDAAEAQRLMESGVHIGKIVLQNDG
jgi:NADPH2:quinone reductase